MVMASLWQTHTFDAIEYGRVLQTAPAKLQK
jgi:hypothetical protein